jgi:hypothetical protein
VRGMRRWTTRVMVVVGRSWVVRMMVPEQTCSTMMRRHRTEHKLGHAISDAI